MFNLRFLKNSTMKWDKLHLFWRRRIQTPHSMQQNPCQGFFRVIKLKRDLKSLKLLYSKIPRWLETKCLSLEGSDSELLMSKNEIPAKDLQEHINPKRTLKVWHSIYQKFHDNLKKKDCRWRGENLDSRFQVAESLPRIYRSNKVQKNLNSLNLFFIWTSTINPNKMDIPQKRWIWTPESTPLGCNFQGWKRRSALGFFISKFTSHSVLFLCQVLKFASVLIIHYQDE